METGTQLRALRGKRPQKLVAQALEITQSALSMYERGRRTPRDEVKRRIAAYYGRSVESLFFATGEHK